MAATSKYEGRDGAKRIALPLTQMFIPNAANLTTNLGMTISSCPRSRLTGATCLVGVTPDEELFQTMEVNVGGIGGRCYGYPIKWLPREVLALWPSDTTGTFFVIAKPRSLSLLNQTIILTSH